LENGSAPEPLAIASPGQFLCDYDFANHFSCTEHCPENKTRSPGAFCQNSQAREDIGVDVLQQSIRSPLSEDKRNGLFLKIESIPYSFY
jgi:hypothetical protein